MANDVGFLELIEIHERRWGTKSYPGRPTLKELMESPIVAVWGQPGGFSFSVYQTPEEINQAVTGFFTGMTGGLEDRRLVKIYYQRREMKFTLQIVRAKTPDPPKPKAETGQANITPFFKVQEARPARYGYTAPGRNPKKLPGRVQNYIKKRHDSG